MPQPFRPKPLIGALCAVAWACGDETAQTDAQKCALAAGDPRREAVETRCDGVDNDCDGVTDLLQPVAANACTTAAQLGNCASGFAACLGGQRLCLTPPAVAETNNGRDDDCDGSTDEAAPSRPVSLRGRPLVPPYLWDDAPDLVPALTETLRTAGIPFDPLPTQTALRFADWKKGLAALDQVALVVVPGYLMPTELPANQLAALESWVEQGGVLVLTKPLGHSKDANAEERAAFPVLERLVGATAAAKHMGATRVAVTANVPTALWLDTAEERDWILTKDSIKLPVESYLYTPMPGTQVWGQALAGSTALGPTLLRKGIGKGAVYTFGVDLLDATDPRCYVNCFDPGRDILAMILRAALREAAEGHAAWAHTVPGVESSVVLLTHDVDAPDAHNANAAWGEAGALRMAKAETSVGVPGTYLVTTDYVAGYYNPKLVGQLCALGQCNIGGHSIQHLAAETLPLGDCAVTKTTYNPAKPTVCGEVVVNLELLQPQLPAGQTIRSWRSPYLSTHPSLFPVLAARGIRFDSSFAVGDLRTNFPVSLERTVAVEKHNRGQSIHTFPIVQEDGLGDELDVKKRTELQAANKRQFLAIWQYALLGNIGNSAWNMVLVHPSYGIGTKPENVQVKIDAIADFARIAKKFDVRFETMDAAGAYWRGRDGVTLAAWWDPAKGYSGTLHVGPDDAPRYSLEFADDIASFACPEAPEFTVRGRRVVFTKPLPAGKLLTFLAKP